MARHALALLVGLTRHNATQLLEQHKELASLVNGAAASYESSGRNHVTPWFLALLLLGCPCFLGYQVCSCRLTWVRSSSIRACQSHKGCVMAGLVVGSDSKKTSPSKLQALGPSINIMDKWARVYLARLCAALLYADWSSTAEFAKGPGAPFWRMLTLLATRCITKPASLS